MLTIAYILFGLSAYLLVGYFIVHLGLFFVDDAIAEVTARKEFIEKAKDIVVSLETLARVMILISWPFVILTWVGRKWQK